MRLKALLIKCTVVVLAVLLCGCSTPTTEQTENVPNSIADAITQMSRSGEQPELKTDEIACLNSTNGEPVDCFNSFDADNITSVAVNPYLHGSLGFFDSVCAGLTDPSFDDTKGWQNIPIADSELFGLFDLSYVRKEKQNHFLILGIDAAFVRVNTPDDEYRFLVFADGNVICYYQGVYYTSTTPADFEAIINHVVPVRRPHTFDADNITSVAVKPFLRSSIDPDNPDRNLCYTIFDDKIHGMFNSFLCADRGWQNIPIADSNDAKQAYSEFFGLFDLPYVLKEVRGHSIELEDGAVFIKINTPDDECSFFVYPNGDVICHYQRWYYSSSIPADFEAIVEHVK